MAQRNGIRSAVKEIPLHGIDGSPDRSATGITLEIYVSETRDGIQTVIQGLDPTRGYVQSGREPCYDPMMIIGYFAEAVMRLHRQYNAVKEIE